MDDRTLRLRCLELALMRGYGPDAPDELRHCVDTFAEVVGASEPDSAAPPSTDEV